MKVVRLHTNDSKERQRLRQHVHQAVDSYDVVLTTYEMVKGEMGYLLQSQLVWRAVVLDEGHKVKNYQTQISHAVHKLRTVVTLLLTGLRT